MPVRIDLGDKELKGKKLSVFRRDLNKKEIIAEKDLISYVSKVKKEFTANLIKEADKLFNNRIKDANNVDEMKKLVDAGNIVRCGFGHFKSMKEINISASYTLFYMWFLFFITKSSLVHYNRLIMIIES